MLNILKMPTYIQLIGLSDVELMLCVGMALSQVDEAEAHHESITEKTKIYHAYKNELAKRKYKHRIH